MNGNHRIWASLLLAVVVVVAGCQKENATPASKTTSPAPSGTTSSSATPAPSKNDTPQTITIWSDVLSSGGTNFVLDAVKEYQTLHPNITVKTDLFPGANRPEKMALAKQSNTLPSIFISGSFTSLDDAHQGLVLPVTDVVETVKSDIQPSALEAGHIKNDYFMIPFFTSPFPFVYNADLFRKAGLDKVLPADKLEVAHWTLDQFENEILPALKTAFAGTEKYALAMYAGNEQADTHNHNLLRMLGGSVFAGGKAATDDNVVKALDMLYGWTQKGYTNSDIVTKVANDARADFQNQKTAIIGVQYSAYQTFLTQMEKGEIGKFDIRIAAVPRRENGKDSSSLATYVSGAVLMNTHKDGEIAASREFLKWLVKDKAVLTKFGLVGIPAFKSIIADVAGKYPQFALLQKEESYVYDFTGLVPGYNETRTPFFQMFQSRFSGKMNSAQALADYAQKANKVIDEYTKRSVILNGK